MKIKTYVLMISKTFPATHPRKGEPTRFKEKILKTGVGSCFTEQFHMILPEELPKIHTIRENYELWKKRVDQINAGKAILSLRQWTGSPYNYARDGSKQVEILRLEKVGIQKISIKIIGEKLNYPWDEKLVPVVMDIFIDDNRFEKKAALSLHEQVHVNPIFYEKAKVIISNDGLNELNFKSWFRKDLDGGCILHFTDFRYA